MKKMAAGEFKAHCLQVMEQVRKTRVPIVITKRGKAVARLIPPHEAASPIFDSLKGKIEIVGDIVSPITPLEDWEGLE